MYILVVVVLSARVAVKKGVENILLVKQKSRIAFKADLLVSKSYFLLQ